ncbi:hypothetical protein HDU89_003705 [Geranomyces variabilis]|nr:hypothetical protein HDU89_003705 [Geranomyces variabilis]
MPPCCGNPRMGAFLKLPGPLNQATAEDLETMLGHIPGLHHIVRKASVFYAHLHFKTLYDAAVFAHGNINRYILVEGLACKVGPTLRGPILEGGRAPTKYAHPSTFPPDEVQVPGPRTASPELL